MRGIGERAKAGELIGEARRLALEWSYRCRDKEIDAIIKVIGA